ncbi:MAG: flagellar motor switch protein FliG [bacterium]
MVAVKDLTGKQKIAILLITLGEEAASTILNSLSQEEVEDITLELASMKSVPPELQDPVLEEFYEMLLAQSYISQGGVGYAKGVLDRALGSDRANEILTKLSGIIRSTPFDFLRKTDPVQILSSIQSEHPQTIALILVYLPPEESAQVMAGLPPEIQIDVAKRIAMMDRTSPEMVREVERVIEQKLSTVLSTEFAKVGGLESLVQLLNRVDRATEKAILENLDETDPELAEEIKKKMFVFEDIKMLDDRAIQQILREVETKDLSLALKNATDEVKDKIFKNMSQRAAATLQEEMEYMGPVRLRDVEDAQQRIVNVVRHLEESGAIIVVRGGEDQFV